MDQVTGTKEPPVYIKSLAKDEPAVPYWGLEYMNWNDKDGQTEESVIDAIMNAAQEAERLSKEASQ